MNLLHLQYFHAVAREGGFTKASQALGIRQPAISRMVGQLESYLGFKLLERRSQNVQLTARGRRVFERAQKIFGEVEQLKISLGEIKGECFGDLKFAAAEPMASAVVPALLKRYLRTYPKVYPQFISGPADYLLKSIQTGALEFGMFFHMPELHEGLAVIERLELPFHLVVRANLKDDRETLNRFIGSREIDDTTTRRFPTLEKWRRRHPEASIGISTNNLTAHKQMVMNGLGIAVLPGFLLKKELSTRRVIDLLPNEHLRFDLKVVARETATLSLNARAFLNLNRDSLLTSRE
ncbi:MAG: LysR family transcriptional regulator [Bdellovibrionales bacterium]|nr:LysR family transcriptional regulator [Bdellovibrionales bacterium]